MDRLSDFFVFFLRRLLRFATKVLLYIRVLYSYLGRYGFVLKFDSPVVWSSNQSQWPSREVESKNSVALKFSQFQFLMAF